MGVWGCEGWDGVVRRMGVFRLGVRGGGGEGWGC